MRALLLTAAAVAVFAALPAQARDLTVMGQADREFTERVAFGDLNFSDQGSARTLRGRVIAAAGRVCASAHRSNDMGGRLIPACTSGTYRDARPAMAQAIAMIKSGKQMAASSILIRVASR